MYMEPLGFIPCMIHAIVYPRMSCVMMFGTRSILDAKPQALNSRLD